MTSHSVKVAVKIRPLNDREQNQKDCIVIQDGPGELKSVQLGDSRCFAYDYVISHRESDDFYNKCVSHLVDGLFNGYNATVLAYGQTGSGKTYSMGTSSKLTESSEEKMGVVPRAALQIFRNIDNIKSTNPDTDIKVETQFLELYQDTLVDLYDHKSSSVLKISQNPLKGVTVPSKFKSVESAKQTMDILQKAALNRQVGGTMMNSESSRSHAIFTIHIRQSFPIKEDIKSKEKLKETLNAKFCLVDLAGSERIGKTGAEGDRKQEGIGINQGLFALGNVISQLGSQKKGILVNYRDSKLTQLLKDSLGGNSKTLMIACISPSAGEINETKSTLDYANRARNIKNTIKVNQDEPSGTLLRYRERIKELEMLLESCNCNVQKEALLEPPNEGETNRSVIDDVKSIEVGVELERNEMLPLPELIKERFEMSPKESSSDIIILEQKNEELQATVESLKIVNANMSHELSDRRINDEINDLKLRDKNAGDSEVILLTQKLRDYKLLNGELELELEQRKQYYSYMDEMRKKKERFADFQNELSSSSLLIDDILALRKQDVDRREDFYKSLPEYIIRPKLKKKKRFCRNISTSSTIMPQTKSTEEVIWGLFTDSGSNIQEYAKIKVMKHSQNAGLIHLKNENGSSELKNKVLVNIQDGPVDVFQPDSSSTPITTHQTHFHSQEQAVEDKKLNATDKLSLRMQDATIVSPYQGQKLLESNVSVHQPDCKIMSNYFSKNSETENEIFSKDAFKEEVPMIVSLTDESVCNQESTLFQDSDYESAYPSVLTMMRKMEVKHQQDQARQKLRKRVESEQTCSISKSLEFVNPINIRDNQEFFDTDIICSDIQTHESPEYLLSNSRDLIKQCKEDIPGKRMDISQQNFESICKSSNFHSYQARLDGRNTYTPSAVDPTHPEEDQANQVMEKVRNGADSNDEAFECSKATKTVENSEYDFFPNQWSSFSHQYRYSTMEYVYDTESCSEENEDFKTGYVINPDVRFLSDDIYQRKMQNTKLEKERSDNAKFKKQTSERIRELEIKLGNTLREKDKYLSKLNESLLKQKQTDSKEMIESFKKKLSNLKNNLSEEKKKTRKNDNVLKDSKQHAAQSKKLKDALEKSEKEKKQLQSSLTNTIKRNETMENDQIIKLRNLEKKAEKNLTKQLSKTHEAEINIKKCKAERDKFEKFSSDNKKKMDVITKESSRLQVELKEAKAKISSIDKLKLIRSPIRDSHVKKIENDRKKEAHSSTAVVKGVTKQFCSENSDRIFDLTNQLVEDKIKRRDVLQFLISLMKNRCTTQIDAKTKGLKIKKEKILNWNSIEKFVQTSNQKLNGNPNSKLDSEDQGVLQFDVWKKTVGNNKFHSVITLVFSFNEQRAKRALETLMRFALDDGVTMNAQLIGEERSNILLTERKYFCDSENFRKFLSSANPIPTVMKYPVWGNINRFRRFKSTNDIVWPSSNDQLTEPWLNFPNSDSVRQQDTGIAAKLNEVDSFRDPVYASPKKRKIGNISNSNPNLKSASIANSSYAHAINPQMKSPKKNISIQSTLSHSPLKHVSVVPPEKSTDYDNNNNTNNEPTRSQILKRIVEKSPSIGRSTRANDEFNLQHIESKTNSIEDQTISPRMSPTKSSVKSTQSKAKSLNVLKKQTNFIKHTETVKINLKAQITSLLLEEEVLIAASTERFIRFVDLSSNKERFSIDLKETQEYVRKIIFSMQDQLLYVALQRKLKIYDTRREDPILELKFDDNDQCIQDIATTMDRNMLYVARGNDISVWDISSKKILGKLQQCTQGPKLQNATVVSICYGIRRNKTPFLVGCYRNRSIKVFDYPETEWAKLDDKEHYVSNNPIHIRDQSFDSNSPTAVYESRFFHANKATIFQWNVQSKTTGATLLTNRNIDGTENRDFADINNITTHPHQPLLITSCRKGSIKFWDPIKLKPYSGQNCVAQHVFAYDKSPISKLSCNSRFIATTNIKNQEAKLWSMDFASFI